MIPIFDGHNDTLLLHLNEPQRDFFERHEDGHLDYPRAKEGGFAGGFFAVFAPGKGPRERPVPTAGPAFERLQGLPIGPVEPLQAVRDTNAMVSQLLRWHAAGAGRFELVTDTPALERCIRDGVVAAILHFEGAEVIDTDLAALDVYYAAGLRSLGIVWSRPNAFGHGVPFTFPASPDLGPGLTRFGFELVERCNELGVMLDLSHITERGFWDVAKTSRAPLAATHSNAHAICPSPRNLTDQQLAAVKASGGVVGLNFNIGFLSESGSRGPELPLATMVKHVDHLVDKLGIDGVAFGSDFDGATMPPGVKDVSLLPNLVQALADAGYDETALHKLGHQNWVRVLKSTWRA